MREFVDEANELLHWEVLLDVEVDLSSTTEAFVDGWVVPVLHCPEGTRRIRRRRRRKRKRRRRRRRKMMVMMIMKRLVFGDLCLLTWKLSLLAFKNH